jgi:putative ABC transport system permease protein
VALAGGAAGLVAGISAVVALGARDGAAGVLSLAPLSLLAMTCALIGIAAGISPARRAARIDPAVALREG